MAQLLWLILALWVIHTTAREYETCIIGAGAAGLQLGHLLHSAGRSYAIFERSGSAGSWWARYPVHRRLISVNTVVTGSSDPEFNMRHDWNSLIENDEVPKVTNRTRDKWPLADVVREYLVDFAQAQEAAGRIHYNTSVAEVSRAKGGGYVLATSAGERVACADVVVATGLPVSNTLQVGEELVDGYENLPPVDEYNGLHVGVLGNGNAAFETVEWLGNHAYVTLMHRARPLAGVVSQVSGKRAQGTRFAMMTHYVGDVRAARLSIFDAYHLKMRDRIIRYDPADTLIVFKCRQGKLCVSPVEGLDGELPMVDFEIDASLRPAAERAIEEYRSQNPDGAPVHALDQLAVESEEQSLGSAEKAKLHKRGIAASLFEHDVITVSVPVELLMHSEGFLDYMQERMAAATAADPDVGMADDVFSLESAGPNIRVLDRVIRCYGWKLDDSIFADDVRPKTVYNGKYPKIDDTYRDPHSGIYYAGALAHSLDFRLSAGGFIHGFRYSARALFRLLEERRHDVPWPSTEFPVGATHEGRSSGREELLRQLLYRIDNAAGPYQMFGGTLLEAIVLQPRGSGEDLIATYYEELPPSYFHERFKDNVRIVWYFEYGHSIHGPEWLYDSNVGATEPAQAEHSTFLHPHMKLYAGDGKASGATVLSEHFVLEDINFSFKKQATHVEPLRRFLELAFDKARESCKASL